MPKYRKTPSTRLYPQANKMPNKSILKRQNSIQVPLICTESPLETHIYTKPSPFYTPRDIYIAGSITPISTPQLTASAVPQA